MKAVGYYRVSTSKQGRSGLGLEAQQATVREFCQREGLDLLNEYTEVETGKGFDAFELRPKLRDAFEFARKTGAVVVVAKLDRLSRSVAFIASLQAKGARFVVAELGMDADPSMIQMAAVWAERERAAGAARTRAALGALKARGAVLGNRTNPDQARAKALGAVSAKADDFAAKVGPIVLPLVKAGLSHREIAKRLNALAVPTARGGRWQSGSVGRVVERLG